LTVNRRLLAQVADARAIAADGGIRHAEALALRPELWVGDFDSTAGALAARDAEVPRLAFPAEKNLTDGELAVEAALARGATRILLVGALGGERADHAMAHVVHAVVLAESGVDVLLSSGDEEGYPLLPGRMVLDLP